MVEKYSQTIRLSNLKGLFRHGCDPHAKSKNMRRKYACIQKLASKVFEAIRESKEKIFAAIAPYSTTFEGTDHRNHHVSE